jgi:hypothetical protein
LVPGDQKLLVHLMITIQKVTSNAQSVNPDCLAADRQDQGDTRLTLTPSDIPNSNYVIMVCDWNCLNIFACVLCCNNLVHRDFLITLYMYVLFVCLFVFPTCFVPVILVLTVLLRMCMCFTLKLLCRGLRCFETEKFGGFTLVNAKGWNKFWWYIPADDLVQNRMACSSRRVWSICGCEQSERWLNWLLFVCSSYTLSVSHVRQFAIIVQNASRGGNRIFQNIGNYEVQYTV